MTTLHRVTPKDRLARAMAFRDQCVSMVVERRQEGRTVHTGTVVSVAELNAGRIGDVIVLRGVGGLDVAFALAQVVTIDRVET